MDKSIIYYTDSQLDEKIARPVREGILKSGLPVVSCSLKPLDFGRNIVLENRERGYVTMVDQIIVALEASTSDYVFFCEHDVLYHPSHFDFTPPRDDLYYYNLNNWRWDYPHDRLIQYDGLTSLSQMCAGRKLALGHYLRRRQRIKSLGLKQTRDAQWARAWGFEPGTKKPKIGGFSNESSERWRSEFPNIDIRHGRNYSRRKVTLDSFKHPPKNWREITLSGLQGWQPKNFQF